MEKKAAVLDDQRSLVNLVYDLTELDPTAEENKDYLKIIAEKMQNKTERYVHANLFIESQIKLFKEQLEFIKIKIKELEAAQSHMEGAALFAMDLLQTNELSGALKGYYIKRKLTNQVRIYDESILPDWAVEKVITKKISLSNIKAHLESGEDVPGAIMRRDPYAYISKPKKEIKK